MLAGMRALMCPLLIQGVEASLARLESILQADSVLQPSASDPMHVVGTGGGGGAASGDGDGGRAATGGGGGGTGRGDDGVREDGNGEQNAAGHTVTHVTSLPVTRSDANDDMQDGSKSQRKGNDNSKANDAGGERKRESQCAASPPPQPLSSPTTAAEAAAALKPPKPLEKPREITPTDILKASIDKLRKVADSEDGSPPRKASSSLGQTWGPFMPPSARRMSTDTASQGAIGEGDGGAPSDHDSTTGIFCVWRHETRMPYAQEEDQGRECCRDAMTVPCMLDECVCLCLCPCTPARVNPPDDKEHSRGRLRLL